MNESEFAPVGLWTLLFLGLAVLGILLTISHYFLLRKVNELNHNLQDLAGQFQNCSRQLDAANAQVVHANTSLGSIADALYVTVRCFRCGKEVRFPSHCRGHTHPCPLCQTHIAIE